MTYFRFTKFNEFILKRIAQTMNYPNDHSRIDFAQAINIIKLTGEMQKAEIQALDDYRRFRNVFIHELGINQNINALKPTMVNSLKILNNVIAKLCR